MKNIEQSSAKIGFKLVEKCLSDENSKGASEEVRNIVNKAMGILQQNGIYAFFLWLEYNGQKNKQTEKIHYYSMVMLKEYDLTVEEVKVKLEDRVEQVKDLINKDFSIDELYFMKSILQKMLTYALYKAKSIVSTGDNNGK